MLYILLYMYKICICKNVYVGTICEMGRQFRSLAQQETKTYRNFILLYTSIVVWLRYETRVTIQQADLSFVIFSTICYVGGGWSSDSILTTTS